MNSKTEIKSVEEALCSLMGMNLSNYSKSRNDLLQLFVNVFKSSKTNNEKISFITQAVKQMVNTFSQAISRDCVPQTDIEQVFGIKADTEITNIHSIPVERAIVGVWQSLLNDKKEIKLSQLEEALLKGILPKIFKIAVEQYTNKNEINNYFKIVKENFDKIPWDHDMHKMINKIFSLHRTNVSQFKKVIEHGMIKIHFGFDKINGFFFYVKDERLEYQEKASDEVNKVCEEADMINAGDGVYLSLYTSGEYGFGKKVSLEAMKVFWKRYGIEKQYLDLLN